MTNPVAPVPEGYHTVTPYLVIAGASEAIEFYAKAFGAKERYRMPGPGGKLMHAEIEIGGSVVMLSDEMLDWGQKSPITCGGTPASIFLYVPDVDAVFQRAVEAGATAQMPPENTFWGDRFSKIKDPFGHEWAIATHIEDVSPEEMEKRAAAQKCEE